MLFYIESRQECIGFEQRLVKQSRDPHDGWVDSLLVRNDDLVKIVPYKEKINKRSVDFYSILS